MELPARSLGNIEDGKRNGVTDWSITGALLLEVQARAVGGKQCWREGDCQWCSHGPCPNMMSQTMDPCENASRGVAG